MKKPYNVDKWSERDLSWKPAGHAETIEEALTKIAQAQAKNPNEKYRARHKDSGQIVIRK